MWEDVNPDVVQKIVGIERNEAQKKFWAFFLLWVLILIFWHAGVRVAPTDPGYNVAEDRGAIIVLVTLLAMIIWTAFYEYSRRTRVILQARYMLLTPCEARERMHSKGTGHMSRGYFVSFRRPDRRASGWVETSQEFFDKCTIGTIILVISEDQADTSRMKAYDPVQFGMEE